jgi:sugar phosphate isomerase/epimerase
MHARVSLHQVAFMNETPGAFVEHCRTLGVPMTLVTSLLSGPIPAGVRVQTLNHPFATATDLERDDGAATEGLCAAIELAASMGAGAVYLITGGRGGLSWEDAAARFVELVAPCRAHADRHGIALLVENASPVNVDIHLAHTLADTITLADMAGIGVCVDLHACWTEAGLPRLFERAAPLTGLVQVSDYVLGDRCAPCRAVPGDGVIPLERLLGDLLTAGYRGVFDLELVGPRIEAEGATAATARGLDALSGLLSRLGV